MPTILAGPCLKSNNLRFGNQKSMSLILSLGEARALCPEENSRDLDSPESVNNRGSLRCGGGEWGEGRQERVGVGGHLAASPPEGSP